MFIMRRTGMGTRSRLFTAPSMSSSSAAAFLAAAADGKRTPGRSLREFRRDAFSPPRGADISAGRFPRCHAALFASDAEGAARAKRRAAFGRACRQLPLSAKERRSRRRMRALDYIARAGGGAGRATFAPSTPAIWSSTFLKSSLLFRVIDWRTMGDTGRSELFRLQAMRASESQDWASGLDCHSFGQVIRHDWPKAVASE